MKKPRLLKEMEIEEISLTSSPSTRTQSHGGRFFIVKADDKDPIDQLQTLIQSSLKGYAVDENDEETKAILDKLPSPEIKEKFLSVCSEFKRVSDDLGDDLITAIIDLAELEGAHFGLSGKQEYGYPANESIIKSALKSKWPSLCTGFSKSELLDMIDDEDVKAEIELEEEARIEKAHRTGMDVDDPRLMAHGQEVPVDHYCDPVRSSIQQYEKRVEKSGKLLWPSLCSQD
jgi:hypothetical protein